MDVNGSTVVVTGGQRGLGRALTDAFLAAGAAKVYVTARTPHPSNDDRIMPIALEVTDTHSVADLAAKTDDADIVVNNAGTVLRESLMDGQIDDVRKAFEINTLGPLRVAQHFGPILASNGGGALVNIASVMAWASGAGGYGATKAALWSLTNTLRVELAAQGTQVVGVHLSYTDTDMTAALKIHKHSPRDAAAAIINGLIAGDSEILVDDDSRRAKCLLSGPPQGLEYSLASGHMIFASDTG